ncbi:hypothetical protein RDI58_022396 [Solanum bulbocastanum]|uniref:Uncharacterized protein n=1 Tax=Solanum bulbocastanum TaxID=147425 RepID=A0AAN8T7W7_SOLBU
MGFWESSTVTFKFLDFEITPTLEEFSSLTELSIGGRLPMIPSAICTGSYEDAFTLVSLERIRNLQVEWEYTINLEIREESWYTLEYYA